MSVERKGVRASRRLTRSLALGALIWFGVLLGFKGWKLGRELRRARRPPLLFSTFRRGDPSVAAASFGVLHGGRVHRRAIGRPPVRSLTVAARIGDFRTPSSVGRRIEKKVIDWDDTAEEWESTPALWRQFVYDGRLALLEFDFAETA